MVSIPKAAELVAKQIREQIISGDLTPGQRLGSAEHLQEQFEVSQPTLREAFRILEAESLIEIARGRHGGVIVRRPNGEHALRGISMVLQSRGVTLADVYDARTLIEPPAVRRLAELSNRASAIRRLKAFVNVEAAEIDDPVTFAEANVKFHEALISESGNKTVLLFCEMLHELLEDAVAEVSGKGSPEDSLAIRHRGIRAQLRLLELIESGAAVKAERYWRDHMAVVGDVMKRSRAVRAVVNAAS
jgi:GntR family transcriptional repressor for pyruvate dehydrogenase complex